MLATVVIKLMGVQVTDYYYVPFQLYSSGINDGYEHINQCNRTEEFTYFRAGG